MPDVVVKADTIVVVRGFLEGTWVCREPRNVDQKQAEEIIFDPVWQTLWNKGPVPMLY